MEIVKISFIALIAAVLCVYFKKYREEYGIFISIVAGIIIFSVTVPYFKDFTLMVQAFSEKGGINAEYIKPALKIVGISYITQYTCELCKDAGQAALAAKLEMAGKLILLALSVPIITSLLDVLIKIIP